MNRIILLCLIVMSLTFMQCGNAPIRKDGVNRINQAQDNYSNDPYFYLTLYLKERHNFILDTTQEYHICFLYCVHCGNCMGKLDRNILAHLYTLKNIVFILDVADPIAVELKSNKNIKVLIDKKAEMYAYGLQGVQHRLFHINKKRISKIELLNSTTASNSGIYCPYH